MAVPTDKSVEEKQDKLGLYRTGKNEVDSDKRSVNSSKWGILDILRWNEL